MEKLIEEIAELNEILGDDKKVKKLIAEQLKKIAKKYGQDRRTELVSGEELDVYKEEEHIEDYPLTVFFTRENYLKKVPQSSLKFTTNAHKLKEDDEVVQSIETTNKSEILFFSNKSTVYKMRTYDIPDGKVSLMGEYLPGLLGMDADEKILYIVVTTDYKGMMLFTFENGKMAKVEVNNYETKTNRKKLIGAYSNKSPIVDIRMIESDCTVVIMSDNNKILCVNTDKIPLKATKSTQGVQVMTLGKRGALVKNVKSADELSVDNLKYYSSRNIPAAGKPLKSEDTQISLI